jgi:hypothetical protein
MNASSTLSVHIISYFEQLFVLKNLICTFKVRKINKREIHENLCVLIIKYLFELSRISESIMLFTK